jgi:hypothetical protein
VDKINKIMLPVAIGAFFVNIWLFAWAHITNLHDMQILAIGNMMLLSFVLIRRD